LARWNRLTFGVTTLRKTALHLLDSLKRKSWESRSDVIERIAKHYLSCPLAYPISSNVEVGVGLQNEIGLDFFNDVAISFPMEVNVVGR
jgi:hypothetical protein